MRQVTSIETRLWHGVVVDGATENHSARRGARSFDEARHIGTVMLSVRVDLQAMREARLARGPQARHHCRALAAVHRQPDQCERVRVLLLKCGEYILGSLVAAVIDDKKRQAMHAQIRDGRADRFLVVVDRNNDARHEAHAPPRYTMTPDAHSLRPSRY